MFLLTIEGKFMDICKKIINKTAKYIINILLPKGRKLSGVYYENSTTKHAMNEGCTLEFSLETEKLKDEIKIEAKEIVKKYFKAPEKLIQYIRTKGINVYRIKNAEKMLRVIGEEEGFITPKKGINALFLNIILGKKPFLTTSELFIFDEKSTEIYTIARAYYKYCGYTKKLPGYDYESQAVFKKLYAKRHQSSPFSNNTIDDLYSCKEALSRDMESINFAIELSREIENSKKALKKIKETDSANI